MLQVRPGSNLSLVCREVESELDSSSSWDIPQVSIPSSSESATESQIPPSNPFPSHEPVKDDQHFYPPNYVGYHSPHDISQQHHPNLQHKEEQHQHHKAHIRFRSLARKTIQAISLTNLFLEKLYISFFI